MEKMPHRGDIQVRPHTAVLDPALSGIRRTISSFPSEVELLMQSVSEELDLIELLRMNAIAYCMVTVWLLFLCET